MFFAKVGLILEGTAIENLLGKKTNVIEKAMSTKIICKISVFVTAFNPPVVVYIIIDVQNITNAILLFAPIERANFLAETPMATNNRNIDKIYSSDANVLKVSDLYVFLKISGTVDTCIFLNFAPRPRDKNTKPKAIPEE